MASSGRFLTSLISACNLDLTPSHTCGLFFQTRNYALRKGTRARKEKIKKRNIELKRIAALKAPPPKKKVVITTLPDAIKYREPNRFPVDDVYLSKFYAWKIYTFEEAIKNHREVLHPTMYNVPNAPVQTKIELDMTGQIQKKFVSTFYDLVSLPHRLPITEERTILAFVGTPEQHQEAQEAGATLIGGSDLIRLIRIGEMSFADYNTIIAHPSILAQLLTIKGILKKSFPTLRQGTLGPDLKSMIHKYLYGIKYTCNPDINFPKYGSTEIAFGTLDMDVVKLEENFRAVINSVQSHKPQRSDPFITRVRIACPPNKEAFKVNHLDYIAEEVEEEDEDEDDDTVVGQEI